MEFIRSADMRVEQPGPRRDWAEPVRSQKMTHAKLDLRAILKADLIST